MKVQWEVELLAFPLSLNNITRAHQVGSALGLEDSETITQVAMFIAHIHSQPTEEGRIQR